LKAALDTVSRDIVLEHGYEENTTISNTKIGLGVAAILFALYAQFGPGKFPANWWQVLVCVVCYVILTTILNYYVGKNEGDAHLVTRARRGEQGSLRLSSRMDRYDDQYSLIMHNGSVPEAARKEVKLTASVTKFFHADGYMSATAFRPEVEALLAEYQAAGPKKSQ